jgi:hypothetical protein
LPGSPARRRRVQADRASYEDNVFVNCPFDRPYRPVFEAIVFAIHDCGFYARSALEVADSAENRLAKIMRIIEECRFGLHDISRTERSGEGLPRFNMPLELGLFLGCKRYGSPRDRRKACLVLDRERYRYQRFISDIAGQDVESHGGDPQRAVSAVRSWLSTSSRRAGIPGGTTIWNRFRRFRSDLPDMAAEGLLAVEELTFVDRTQLISNWLLANAP